MALGAVSTHTQRVSEYANEAQSKNNVDTLKHINNCTITFPRSLMLVLYVAGEEDCRQYAVYSSLAVFIHKSFSKPEYSVIY